MEEINTNNKDNNERYKSSLKRVGNFIKEARLSRDQSTEELASILKIGEHQLKAIENGDKDNLPEEVFIKAMVRRISDKLKLDTQFIMGEFNKTGKEVKIEKITEESSIKSKKNKEAKRKNLLSFGILIILSGTFGLIASSLIFNFFSESQENKLPKIEIIKRD